MAGRFLNNLAKCNGPYSLERSSNVTGTKNRDCISHIIQTFNLNMATKKTILTTRSSPI